MQETPPHAETMRSFGGVELAPEHAARLGAEDRRVVQICLGVLGVLSVGSMAGTAFSLYLVKEAPLLLIGLSPLGRHFVLVAPSVDLLPFLAVGIGRRLAFYTACYFLGRSLGPIGLVWLEARAAAFARWVRWLERLFDRAGWGVLLAIAGPTTSLLAGIARMRLWVFLTLATISLFVRLLVMYEFAELLREPIEELLMLIEEYRAPGTILMILGILIWQLVKRRRAAAA